MYLCRGLRERCVIFELYLLTTYLLTSRANPSGSLPPPVVGAPDEVGACAARACAAAAAPRVSDIGTCARPRPHWCSFSLWLVLEASMELSACPHEVCSMAGTSDAA